MRNGVVAGLGTVLVVAGAWALIALVLDDATGPEAPEAAEGVSVEEPDETSGGNQEPVERLERTRHRSKSGPGDDEDEFDPDAWQPVTPPLVRKSDSAKPLEETGGWTPSAELLERAVELAIAVSIHANDPLELGWAVDDHPTAEEVELWRAALRLADPEFARAVALQIPIQVLDEWEMARVAELVGPLALIHPEYGGYSFEDFVSIASRDEAAAATSVAPDFPDESHTEFTAGRIGDRATTPEQLGARADRIVASGGTDPTGENLQFHLDSVRTGRRRVARGLLTLMDRPLPDEVDLDDGLPRHLVALLRADALGSQAGESPGDTRAFALRWLLDETPAEHDIELLVELSNSNDYDVAHAAYLTLMRMDSATAIAHLRRTVDEGSGAGHERFSLAGLVRQGDLRALDELAERAVDDAQALALLFEVHPARGREVLARVLFDEERDDDQGMYLLTAAHEERLAWGLRWPVDALDPLEPMAVASDLPARRLLYVALAHPAFYTRGVAREICRRLDPDDASALANRHCDLPFDRDGGLAIAFLDLAAPEELRRALLRLSNVGEPATRLEAIHLRLELGDETLGEAMVKWLRSGKDSPVYGEPMYFELASLGGCRGEAVTEFLREVVLRNEDDDERERATEALAALLVQSGRPAVLAEAIDPWEVSPGIWTEICTHAAAGRMDRVVARTIELGFVDGIEGAPLPLGTGAGPLTRSALAARARSRHLGEYVSMTYELAIAGDEAARREVARALDAGRELWIMDRTARQVTLEFDPETLDAWIARTDDAAMADSLRYVYGGGGTLYFAALAGLVEFEATLGVTAHEALVTWRHEWSMPFVRHPLAGTYVPTPR